VPSLFERDTPSGAFIYFPGTAPPPDAAFGRLRGSGIDISPRPVPAHADETVWSVALDHPEWGTAELTCFREPPEVEEFTQFANNLTDVEKANTAGSRAAVMLSVPAKRKNVLRDRKTMLRYAAAVMGGDGILAIDLGSRLPWSRASLDDELIHDADLDIDALYCIHAVLETTGATQDERVCSWLHTHGLGEIGAFDIDILRPSVEFERNCGEPIRALAFHILGGRLKESSEEAAIGSELVVRTVPAADFMRDASADDRAPRDMVDDHTDRRAILCEPTRRRMFGLRRDRPEPLRFAQSSDILERGVLYFPEIATELMASRAKATIQLLPPLVAEFAEFDPQPIVKLGYPTDSGQSREHLWFDFHGLSDDAIDATLQNEPYSVSSLRPGERHQHPRDLLTDWMLMTPAGTITPRSLSAARRLREEGPKVRAALADWRRAGGGS
jgi:uncharacterized protein YegJ (DUF2314 family)